MTPKQARKSRGWTVYEAATRAGVGPQQITNLENKPLTAGSARVSTLLALFRVYWPDLTLQEFLLPADAPPESLVESEPLPLDVMRPLFELVPRSAKAYAELYEQA